MAFGQWQQLPLPRGEVLDAVAGKGLAVQLGHAQSLRSKHAPHLMIAAFLEGEARALGLKNLQLGRQAGRGLIAQLQLAGGEDLDQLRPQIAFHLGHIDLVDLRPRRGETLHQRAAVSDQQGAAGVLVEAANAGDHGVAPPPLWGQQVVDAGALVAAVGAAVAHGLVEQGQQAQRRLQGAALPLDLCDIANLLLRLGDHFSGQGGHTDLDERGHLPPVAIAQGGEELIEPGHGGWRVFAPVPCKAQAQAAVWLFMTLTRFSLALLLLATALPAAEPPAGFRALFNGRDLEGWHGLNPHSVAKLQGEKKAAALAAMRADFANHWRVENGELVNDGHGPYATTNEDFGDIELLIEYTTVPKADSGIYLRGLPQVQIWDRNQVFDPKKPDRKPHLGSGGLFNNTPGKPGRDPLVVADRDFGQWNQFRIRQIGARTWVWLNDQLVVDGAVMENYEKRDQPLPARGPILLQTHGGEIRWRNIFIKTLKGDEAKP